MYVSVLYVCFMCVSGSYLGVHTRLPAPSLPPRAKLLIPSMKKKTQDEFVTAGGVSLGELDLKTMESKKAPGLFIAGEAADIDGVTGGYNFQACWTTGYLAGRAMARRVRGWEGGIDGDEGERGG